MIAPPDLTLTKYPKFDALYRDLCTNKLNADATSKLDPKAQKERDGLSEEIHKARVEAARKSLVRNGLQHLSYAPSGLPEEIQEFVAVVAALLDDQIAEEDRLLLHDDLLVFKRNINSISAALSILFREDAGMVATLMDPNDALEPKVLPQAIAEMKNAIAAYNERTSDARLAFLKEAGALHEAYRQIIEICIRTLEQTIHGSVARGTKAKADYLAAVAEGMAKKLELQRNQFTATLYSGDIQESLKSRSTNLGRESSLVKTKIREAESQLEEYGKASGIKKMAAEYAEIVRETERVRAEIQRLQSSQA